MNHVVISTTGGRRNPPGTRGFSQGISQSFLHRNDMVGLRLGGYFSQQSSRLTTNVKWSTNDENDKNEIEPVSNL